MRKGRGALSVRETRHDEILVTVGNVFNILLWSAEQLKRRESRPPTDSPVSRLA